MRKFKPGQRVRVEIDAVIVEQATKDNPYWYAVLLADGTAATVNIGRISALADEPVVTRDSDGSVLILSNRLTAEGARHLLGILSDYANNPVPTACTQDESEVSHDP